MAPMCTMGPSGPTGSPLPTAADIFHDSLNLTSTLSV